MKMALALQLFKGLFLSILALSVFRNQRDRKANLPLFLVRSALFRAFSPLNKGIANGVYPQRQDCVYARMRRLGKLCDIIETKD